MSWQRIIGQHRVKELLQRALQTKQVAHAYLLYGQEGIGKDALALEFAKVLNCLQGGAEACDECTSCRKFETLQHPNVRFIVALPVGKGEKQGDRPTATLSDDQIAAIQEQFRMKARDPYHRIEIPKANFIKINSVRELKRESALSRSEGGRKVVIISNADRMNAEASNSLLKTLEEPLGDTVLLLTTSERDQLLPTIISRCQLLQCDPLQEEEIEQALRSRDSSDPAQAALAARMAGGSYAVARDLLSNDMVSERAEVVAFLRTVVGSQKIFLANAVEGLASSRDKVKLERWLKLLQSWLREALIFKEGGIHTSFQEGETSVQSFVQKFPSANLVSAQEVVELGIAHLNKNVYLPLVLLKLSVDLKTALTEKP